MKDKLTRARGFERGQMRQVQEMRLVVTAPDYEKAIEFYRDVLGLPELATFSDEGGRVAILAAGAATLELGDERHAAYVDQVEVGRRVAGHIRVAFRVEDAALTLNELRSHDATIVAEATTTPWGSRNARLDGPADLHLTVFSDQAPAPTWAPGGSIAREPSPARPAPGAGVAVRDPDGRILLVHRAADGYWALPGGHLEEGESFSACARRDFKEETGAAVELTGLLGIYSEPSTQMVAVGGEAVQFVGIVFEGRTGGQLGTGTEDVDELGWFDQARLPTPLWGPDVPVIEDAFSEASRPFIR
jgi:lactoylglutathione lyase